MIEIAHVPDASADEERCNRREYWLWRPVGKLLMAADCDVQWGADNAGPAEVRVTGAVIEVRYVEFQANDRCEYYTATVDVGGAKILTQNRLVGAVSKNTCMPAQERVPLPPAGDGSPGHPLVPLHRE